MDAKHSEATLPRSVRTSFFRLERETFAGYVVDEADLNRRFVLELWLDGLPFRITRADVYTNELSIERIGDSCYGYAFTLPEQTINQATTVEIRIANTNIPIGYPILLNDADAHTAKRAPASDLRWLGGLRFEGWCGEESESAPTVVAVIDGERVAEAKATSWANIGKPGDARCARRFDLHLPTRFADGRVRNVRFLLEGGEEFSGGPVSFVAFQDGLREAIGKLSEFEWEQQRAAQFDRILPMSLPFSEYVEWNTAFPLPKSENLDTAPMAIALVGPGEPKDSLLSLRESDFPDWLAAPLSEAEGQSGFDLDQLEQFVTGDAKKCDYVIFAHNGASFAHDCLGRVAAAFRVFDEAVAVYGDFDVLGRDGRRWPVALPAFDYERMLEQGYCSHFFALRTELVGKAVEAGVSDLYRLFMFIFDEGLGHRTKIVHIPGALCTLSSFDFGSDKELLIRAVGEHLRVRKVAADVTETSRTSMAAVRVVRSISSDSTTIIIPVRNRLELLRSCLRSIQPAVASGNVEIMIVDNDSTDPNMKSFLKTLDGNGATVLSVPGAFNFPHLNNMAAKHAKGKYLCLLNNDVKAIDDRWLREMLSRINEEDVGAVGALLLWPSGIVQHAGTVLGANFAATHAFCDRFHTDPGYTDLLCVARECSAVTAACLVTRRQDYLEAGGMDELQFPVNFNDVDYCLKLRAKGKRIVFTPHAKLFHLESASRGEDKLPDRAARFARELQNLRARWGEHLIADPYYSPVLSLDPIPYSALAWPPRSRQARIMTDPKPVDIPPGF
jgi:O-antigen biosynthesis protein